MSNQNQEHLDADLIEPSPGSKGSRLAGGLIVLIPAASLMATPFYNSAEPSVLGFPFFYWWQIAWIVISAVATWLAGIVLESPGAATSPVAGPRP